MNLGREALDDLRLRLISVRIRARLPHMHHALVLRIFLKKTEKVVETAPSNKAGARTFASGLPEGWTAVLEANERGIDGAHHYHADVYRAGEWVCRIALLGTFIDAAAAQVALNGRMQAWLEDYESRPHSGDSGFQLL